MKQSERDKHNAKFGQWPRENPRRGKPDWERSLLFLNRFTVFYLEKHTTTKITEPKNTSKTVPEQQTDLQTNLPWKLCLYGFSDTAVRNLYGPVLMYGTFSYGCTDLSVHYTDKLFSENLKTVFLLEKYANCRKTCKNSFFSKTVQKLCFWSSLFLISVPYFSLSANHFLMSRNNFLSLSMRLSLITNHSLNDFSVMPFPMNEVFNDPSWLKTLTTH